MDKYKALYKCRLCGARFYGKTFATTARDAAGYVVHMAAGVCGLSPTEPTGLHLHECADGSMGLAVFLGMERQPTRVAEEKTESGLLED
ncbi:MAG: hypothetical protein IKY92_03760 [Akkermansia sp.]|nr:hypothetical protein [Akkermansia sp.]